MFLEQLLTHIRSPTTGICTPSPIPPIALLSSDWVASSSPLHSTYQRPLDNTYHLSNYPHSMSIHIDHNDKYIGFVAAIEVVVEYCALTRYKRSRLHASARPA